MERKRKRKIDLRKIMRALHRDLGFLTIGLTIVYALSGMLLIYRNTDFMKVKRTEEIQLDKNIAAPDLGQHVHIRNFRVEKEEEGILYFKEGNYNAATGVAIITLKVYPAPVAKLVSLHKVNGNSKKSVVALIYGIILAFFAISAMFMYKLGTRKSNRSMIMIGGSVAITIIIVMLA